MSSTLATHAFPMLPLANALAGGGHEVEFAAPPGTPWPGLPTHRVGTVVDYDSVFAKVLHAPAPPSKPRVPRVLGLFADVAADMFADLLALLGQRHYDLVVFEPMALAAPLAARLASIPSVRFRFGPDLLEQFFVPLLEQIPGWLAGDTDPGELAGTITLDPCPPAMRSPSANTRLPIRYIPAWPGVARALPEDSRPRVCVSWGSTLFRLSPQRFLAGSVIRALAGEECTVLVVARREQVAALGTLPANATLLLDLPLQLATAGADVLVGHGGAGTILTAATAGIPQLHVPQLPDHRFHSAAIAGTGAARVLAPELIGDELRAAVRAIRADHEVKQAVAELSRWIAAAPSPEDVAGRLPALAAGR